jgi:hypothetical protein
MLEVTTDAFRSELAERRRELLAFGPIAERDLMRLARHDFSDLESLLADVTDSGGALATILILKRLLGESEKHAFNAPLVASEARLLSGSVEVHGDLINESVFAVTGDLTIHGVYAERGEFAHLLVGGRLVVDHLVTEHAVHVAGDLTASGVVFGSGNDHMLVVGGELAARVLVEDDHATRYRTLRVARHVRDVAHLPAVFDTLLFASDGSMDRGALEAALRAGRPVVLEGTETMDDGAVALTPRLALLVQAASRATSCSVQPADGGRACVLLVNADGSKQRSFVSVDEKTAFERAIAARRSP